uniref:recombinase family protein n=1 Tax=Escherichia coli TaxID=562 RepID=UPI001E4028EF
MLIGYARVSKADGSQSLDLQHDALRAAGVERDNIYDDLAWHCCKVSDEAAFCLIQRPYISKTLLT